MMESKTGVYYQALPAVGPDGKNVMKLIPVQKVNGKFFHTQALTVKNDCQPCQPQVYSQPAHLSPASFVQSKFPTLHATADGRFILKTPPESNILLNSVKIQQQGASELFQNAPSLVQAPLLASKLTQPILQLPPPSSNNTVTVSSSAQQPAPLKSPVFPSGHYLQIPPNATVRTLPASALPQSIKSQICISSNPLSDPSKSLQTVVYVSPVSSLKLGPDHQIPGLTKASELPQSLAPTPSTSTASSLNVSSTSSAKADQGVAAPMKWVIQEGAGNIAPCLIPVTSPSMPTDILKAVKQMETLRKANEVPAGEPKSAHATQEKISPGKDNALVMCNGKVYFVAKKNSEISKDVIFGVASKAHLQNSASGSGASNAAPNQESKIVVKKPNEIIDLCDDDEESPAGAELSRLSVLGEATGENDEDSNVIFVSYIPPKSDTKAEGKDAETAPQNGCGTETGSAQCEAGNMGISCEGNSSNSAVIDFDVSRCRDNVAACASVNDGGGALSEQPEEVCDQGTEVTKKVSADSVTQCRQQDTEMVAETSLEKTASEEMHQQKSDSELRKCFGIHSDLKVGLTRINQAKRFSSPIERRTINKRTLEGIRKLFQESQIELKIKQLIQAKVHLPKNEGGPKDAKRKRLELNEQTCVGSSTSRFLEGSSPQAEDTVNCVDKMQSVSTDAHSDNKVLLGCPGPGEETPSTSGSTEVGKQPVEPRSFSSSFQSQQTQVARSRTDGTACTSVSRKTPARQSKGSGRVCTACPCGTKVGALTASSYTPPDMPNPSTCVLTQSNKACNTVDKVLENSSSSPPVRNEELEKPEDETVHSSQSCETAEEASLQNTSTSVTQLESVSQPDLSSQGQTSSSTSKDNVPVKKCEKGTNGHVEKTKHDPNTPEEMKAPTSSGGQLVGVGENIPSEIYTSISLGPEEIKRRERIKRLKDLLKEKEEALEKLRKSM